MYHWCLIDHFHSIPTSTKCHQFLWLRYDRIHQKLVSSWYQQTQFVLVKNGWYYHWCLIGHCYFFPIPIGSRYQRRYLLRYNLIKKLNLNLLSQRKNQSLFFRLIKYGTHLFIILTPNSRNNYYALFL